MKALFDLFIYQKTMIIVSYYLTLNPIVFSHSSVRVTTLGTFLSAFVK